MLADEDLIRMAEQVTRVDGILGVVLGGSRARGEEHADSDSDTDLGIYYDAGFDLADLRSVAARSAGSDAALTEPGGWGPWVDGGGWLQVKGAAVDWIYREYSRVEDAWSRAQLGDVHFHIQAGHPAGVTDVAYAGELAVARILTDPTGRLTTLQEAASTYPEPLRLAFTTALWEATFVVDGAARTIDRADTVYVVGCVFRAVVLCVHALHAQSGRWLINEKGAVDAAGRLAVAPPDFASRAHALLGAVGTTPAAVADTLHATRRLVEETIAACPRPPLRSGRAPRGSSSRSRP